MGKVKELKVNPKNPRVITDEKLEQLKKSMDEYGDISGIVFNRRTGNLVGGNQRSKDLDSDAEVVITKKFEKPSKKGTVAIGYILHRGERFSYREVEWSKNRETAAMIAANKNAGNWDSELLKSQLESLSKLDFDIGLTMFDQEELRGYGVGDTVTVSEHERERVSDEGPQHLVIVQCKNEREVEKLYDEFTGRGLNCKIM